MRDKIIELMINNLKIDKEIAETYLKLLLDGKASIDKLGIDKSILDRLVEDGACIEIDGMYQALNPKFAITNMYRMRCIREGIEMKRNKEVDKIATILEGLLERRAK
ncbi:MAG: hypothetical protein KatS3mg003_0539 [Candidatus Nitrosocaldaceae archaeon]|nr:MAG: hypothetical protein KatS3mg003_0539 [Candidatus Nitrosocaldaceae archaeon]